MAHFDDLSSALQTALNKGVPGPFQVEVILDPDGDAIDLSSYIDRSGSLTITKSKAIRSFGSLGRFTVGRVTIPFINTSNYFSSFNTSSPFYQQSTRLYDDKLSTDTIIKVPKGQAENLNGREIVIQDRAGSATFTVNSIDTTPTDYDNITLDASGSRAFDGGSLIETKLMIGKKITIKSTVSGTTEKIDQFTGFVASLPEMRSGNRVVLTCDDLFRTLLDTPLKANSAYRILDSNGTTETDISHTNVEGSDGVFSPTSIVITQSKAKIGLYKMVFTSATDYTLTDPDGFTTAMNKSDAFGTVYDYGGTDGSTMLSIPDVAFTGTFAAGDEIEFRLFCTLGHINFHDTIPEMIQRLLLDNYGAGLAAGDLDGSFDTLNADYDEMRAGITFSQTTTVLKAIEQLQAHINASVFYTNDGKFSISAYRPDLVASPFPTLSPASDLIQIGTAQLNPIGQVKGKYNHSGGSYQSELSWPVRPDAIGNIVSINLPAYNAEDRGQVLGAISRIYAQWRRGLQVFKLTEKFEFGIGWDINDRFQVSGSYPTIPTQNVEIYSVTKNLLKGTVQAEVADIDYVFGRYCFTDQNRTNQGYVVW